MIHPTIKKDKLKPTTEQVRELFQMLKNGVNHVVEGHPRGVMPMFGVTCYCPFKDQIEQRIHCLAVDDFSSNLGKKRTMKMLAAHIFQDHKIPLVVGLVSEAWMAKIGKDVGWDEYKKKHLMVSQDPNRIEVVQVSAQGFYGPATDRIAFMDCRQLSRKDGRKDGEVSWGADWQGLDQPDKDGKQMTPECNILDQFFNAYVGFGLKHEDYHDYLGTIMEAPTR